MSQRGGADDITNLLKDGVDNLIAEPIRELTGANATRKSLMDQNQALVEAKAQKAKDLADERTRAAQNDMRASLAAVKKPTALGTDIFNPLGTAVEPLGLTPDLPAKTPNVKDTKTTPIQQTYERNFLGL